METIKWIWTYLKDYKYRYGIGLIFVLLSASIVLVRPVAEGKIIDEVLIGGDTNQLMPYILLILGVVLLKNLMDYGYRMNFEWIAQDIIFRIRKDLYERLQELDCDYYKETRTGDIMARMTGDTDALRHFIAWVIYNIFYNLGLFVFGIISMWIISPQLTLIMCIICPFVGLCTIRMRREVGPAFEGIREAYSSLNSVVQENISGNRIVKAFSKEEYEIQKFEGQNNNYREANLKANHIMKTHLPRLEFLTSSFSVIMILVGGIFVINGELTIGELVMFNGMLWALNMPMRLVGPIINDTQRFIASSIKIRQLLETETKIKNTEEVEHVRRIKGSVKFDNVSFSFEDTDALKKVSFEVKEGETVGIIGHTGAGKSTLINLIARFHEPVSGKIYIDGKDITHIDIATLRDNVAIAMQDVFLFSDTVWANIAFGTPKATKGQIRAIAEIADADDFIRGMPEGYETIIGERGVGLSGGQRQRIALARALIKDPSILILDDTTSAVDMETEAKIQKEIKKELGTRTTFIIAHRISSVKEADKILVLEDGWVTEQGTHDELVEKQGKYYEVYNTQYGDFNKMKEGE